MLEPLLAFLLPIPITAATYTFPGYTVVPPQAPIRLDACEASSAIARGLAQASSLSYGTGFTILGDQAARSVVIRFSYVDRSEKELASSEARIDGTFTPGVKIMRTHRYGGDFHEHRSLHGAVAVFCSPVEVTFANGSVWHTTVAPQPTAAPGGAVRPTPAPVGSAAPARTPLPDVE